MSELVNFSEIDEYDTERWTPEQLEAASFLNAMDWEGGITGLLYYNTDAFPEELRDQAEFVYNAIEDLNREVNRWANERGVRY
jgi:hypothetical protein